MVIRVKIIYVKEETKNAKVEQVLKADKKPQAKAKKDDKNVEGTLSFFLNCFYLIVYLGKGEGVGGRTVERTEITEVQNL